MARLFTIPPIEKVHEALSAIADNRVKISDDSTATVSSSDYTKNYTLSWTGDDTYSSNDNASFFVGYIGYPLLALLMLQGKIKYNHDIVDAFKGINWKALNTQNKNNYSKCVTYVMDTLKEKGIDTDYINEEIGRIYDQVKQLKIIFKRSALLPPK